jgi:FkbM family methyltransferase
MVDVRTKAARIAALSKLLGPARAIVFELAWSIRLPEVTLSIPNYPAFSIRRNDSDLSVFWPIFIEGELSAYVPHSPRLIIDGGANVGFSTSYLAKRYPSAQIVAIEPSSDNCARIKQHCAGFDNVTILQGGLWSHAGFLRIQNPHDASWAFRCELADTATAGAFPAFTIRDIIDRFGAGKCDLIKLDIEGAETHLFAPEHSNWIDRIGAILVEVHSDEAMEAIAVACPESRFDYSKHGEKLLIMPRY